MYVAILKILKFQCRCTHFGRAGPETVALGSTRGVSASTRRFGGWTCWPTRLPALARACSFPGCATQRATSFTRRSPRFAAQKPRWRAWPTTGRPSPTNPAQAYFNSKFIGTIKKLHFYFVKRWWTFAQIQLAPTNRRARKMCVLMWIILLNHIYLLTWVEDAGNILFTL